MRVKLIWEQFSFDIEGKINEWLGSNQEIIVIDVDIIHTGNALIGKILYEPNPSTLFSKVPEVRSE